MAKHINAAAADEARKQAQKLEQLSQRESKAIKDNAAGKSGHWANRTFGGKN